MNTIKRKLTPQQRQFWFRVAQKKYMPNDRAHKWKIDRRGRAPNECHVCRNAIETWEHMEYDCDGVKKWMEKMKDAYEDYADGDEWRIPARDEWRRTNTEDEGRYDDGDSDWKVDVPQRKE